MIWNVVGRLATLILGVDYESVITQGEIAKLLGEITEQTLALTGAGLLLGLGFGTIFSAAGIYFYKRRQLHQRLHS